MRDEDNIDLGGTLARLSKAGVSRDELKKILEASQTTTDSKKAKGKKVTPKEGLAAASSETPLTPIKIESSSETPKDDRPSFYEASVNRALQGMKGDSLLKIATALMVSVKRGEFGAAGEELTVGRIVQGETPKVFKRSGEANDAKRQKENQKIVADLIETKDMDKPLYWKTEAYLRALSEAYKNQAIEPTKKGRSI